MAALRCAGLRPEASALMIGHLLQHGRQTTRPPRHAGVAGVAGGRCLNSNREMKQNPAD